MIQTLNMKSTTIKTFLSSLHLVCFLWMVLYQQVKLEWIRHSLDSGVFLIKQHPLGWTWNLTRLEQCHTETMEVPLEHHTNTFLEPTDLTTEASNLKETLCHTEWLPTSSTLTNLVLATHSSTKAAISIIQTLRPIQPLSTCIVVQWMTQRTGTLTSAKKLKTTWMATTTHANKRCTLPICFQATNSSLTQIFLVGRILPLLRLHSLVIQGTISKSRELQRLI